MQEKTVGVGPHPRPWPEGEQYDEALLAAGDARNVIDKYRYWRVDAIKADLDATRLPLEIAIENWQHDFNIGTIVRNANAFNARAVHIIGKRHWNKRGAMVTDVYMHVFYHKTVADFMEAMSGKVVIAIDNQAGASSIFDATLPKDAVFVFGGEGPGLSAEMIAASSEMVMIPQFGSTRSLNVGVASGVVMYEWLRRNGRSGTDVLYS